MSALVAVLSSCFPVQFLKKDLAGEIVDSNDACTKGFITSVYAHARTHCLGCHETQFPRIAAIDLTTAYKEALSVVDFADPVNSILTQKTTDGHSSNAASNTDGTQMSGLITQWGNDCSTPPPPPPPPPPVPPVAPVLSATMNDPTIPGQIEISWVADPVADSYAVFSNGNCNGTPFSNNLPIPDSSGVSAVLFDAPLSGTLYTFSARASNAVGTSACSGPVQGSAVAVISLPGAPSLTASDNDTSIPGQIRLSVNAVFGATGYKYFSNGTCSGNPIFSTAQTTVLYSPPQTQTQYTFSAVATNSLGSGPCGNSDTGSAAPVPSGYLSNQVTIGTAPTTYKIYAFTFPGISGLTVELEVRLQSGATQYDFKRLRAKPASGVHIRLQNVQMKLNSGSFVPAFAEVDSRVGGGSTPIISTQLPKITKTGTGDKLTLWIGDYSLIAVPSCTNLAGYTSLVRPIYKNANRCFSCHSDPSVSANAVSKFMMNDSNIAAECKRAVEHMNQSNHGLSVLFAYPYSQPHPPDPATNPLSAQEVQNYLQWMNSE